MLSQNLCSAEIFTYDDAESIFTSAIGYLAVKGEHEFLSLKDILDSVRLTCNDSLMEATTNALRTAA